jgi:succinate dehydrogenase / fumarate reductase flavoprotein subunit
VGPTGYAVYLDFADAIKRDGKDVIRRKYGNLFDMYQNITDDNPYETPMMIYPASHYTMGGLWVDYELQTTIPGLFSLGESNFSDHGANRLGASALMQGLADGYFVIPYTIGPYLATNGVSDITEDHQAFRDTAQQAKERDQELLSIDGKQTVREIHVKLGKIMVEHVGMARNETGLKQAIEEIRSLREEFWKDVKVPGSTSDYNLSLQKAGRLADYLEFAEVMALDALERDESCGCHLREEHQTEENEAKRDDENYCHVAAWEYDGYGNTPKFHKEPLNFENVELTQRSYK